MVETLPYDLVRLVWVYTDYETIKPLCAQARVIKETEPSPWALIRELADDPSVWVEKLNVMDNIKGVIRSNFWNRSIVERTLPLPEPRVQMRYVEIVSRRGVVSDSIYFVTELAMVIRGYELKRLDLVFRYRNTVKSQVGVECYNKLLVNCRNTPPSSFRRSLEYLDGQSSAHREDYFMRLLSQSIWDGDGSGFLRIIEKGTTMGIFFNNNLQSFYYDLRFTKDPNIISTLYYFFQSGFSLDTLHYDLLLIMFASGRFDFIPVIEQLIRESSGNIDGPFSQCLEGRIWENVLKERWISERYGLEILEHLLSWGLHPGFITQWSDYQERHIPSSVSRAVMKWLLG